MNDDRIVRPPLVLSPWQPRRDAMATPGSVGRYCRCGCACYVTPTASVMQKPEDGTWYWFTAGGSQGAGYASAPEAQAACDKRLKKDRPGTLILLEPGQELHVVEVTT